MKKRDQDRIFRLKQQVDSKTYAIIDAVLETNPSLSFHDATQQLLKDVYCTQLVVHVIHHRPMLFLVLISLLNMVSQSTAHTM